MIGASPAIADPTTFAEDVNAEGLARFSRLPTESGAQDVVASPLAYWYLNRFNEAQWNRLRAGQPANIARAPECGIALRVWPIDRSVRFGKLDVELAERALGATVNRPPFTFGAATHASEVLDDGAVFTVLLSLRRTASFKAPISIGQEAAQGYDDGSITGARFDSDDGRTQLFLFWTSPEQIAPFRKSLTLARWKTIVASFGTGTVNVAGVPWNTKAFTELQPSSGDAFGALVEPGLTGRHDLLFSENMTIDQSSVSVDVNGALHLIEGPSTVRSRGTIEQRYPSPGDSSGNGVPAVPPEQRFAGVPPMLYAVVDTETGVILLIGSHE